MPVQFSFKKSDDTAATLQDVDEEICKYAGIPVDENNYSAEYMDLTTMGIAILLQLGGSKTTKEKLDRYFTKYPRDHKNIAYEFLVDRYTFEAWR